MRLSRKLSLYSGGVVLVTVLASAVAISLITAQQEQARNEQRLISASDRFTRTLQQEADELARGWQTIAQDEALNTAMLNSIQQNIFYLSALPEIFLLDRTLELDRFAIYFPERFEGDELLQIYADEQLGGVVRTTVGKHFLHTRGEATSNVVTIDDPELFPSHYPAGETLSLRSDDEQFLLVARYDYRNLVESWGGGGGVDFEQNRHIGYFVLERALGVDIATFEREAGALITLYDRSGEQVGGHTNLTQANADDLHSESAHTRPLVDADGQVFDSLVCTLEFDGERIGHFAVSISQEATSAKISRALQTLFAVLLFVLALILPTCVFLAGRFSRPVERLTEAASRIAAGDLEHPIGMAGDLELRVLANNLEQMRDAVRTKIHDLSAEVHKRRSAEERLRASEEDLTITLNSIGDAVIATDVEGRVTRMNPVAEELLAEGFESCRGRAVSDIYRVSSAESGKVLLGPVDIALKSGRKAELQNGSILENRGGQRIRVADCAAPIRNARDELVGAVLCFRNVTASYELEQRLRQSQKMEAVGQLAGGIAHDFNNLLTAIMGFAELIGSSPSGQRSPESLTRCTEHILNASQRASALTSQLLTFSRKRPISRELSSVNKVIDDSVQLLRVSLGPSVEIRCLLGEDQFAVVDAASIESVLINLGVNARDAMEGNGCLTIETRRVELDPDFCASQPLSCLPGAFVEISLADSGSGITDEDLEHIFEPFFTTKEVGKGTGLGLAATYGILQEHQGTIRVESQLGRGTVFRLYLPLGDDQQPAPQDSRAIRSGQGRILIADDEEAVRDLMTSALTQMGYEILVAENGEQAIELFEEHREDIDLIMLDLMMPVMNGGEALRRIRDLQPDINVLIATGYADQAELEKLTGLGPAQTVRKPFSLVELSGKVAHALLDHAGHHDFS